jgi:hypothetical protein
MRSGLWLGGLLILVIGSAVPAGEAATTAPIAPPLPVQTSRYNHGGHPGRYRDSAGGLRRFALKQPRVTLYDGSGRSIGEVDRPVLLNVGAFKEMSLDGADKNPFAWAWNTSAGSGWIALNDLKDPPPVQVDPQRDPRPPHESDHALTIDCARGRDLLSGLRHVDSRGAIPRGGGNKGEHYAGRNPGEHDYVYLLFEVPNVQHGGMARDSLPNGSRFIPALDAEKKPITETMTMYRDGDPKRPVPVTFLYGRAEGGIFWGWLARANVGRL